MYYALKHLVEEVKNVDVHIINMSLDVTSALIRYIQPLVNDLHKNGSVIVCAGTKKGSKSPLSNLSKLKNTIRVGVFNESYFQDAKQSGHSNELTIRFLNKPLTSTLLFPNATNSFQDSSAYTALVSGLLASYLSQNHVAKKDRFNRCEDFLKECASPLQNETEPKPYTPYI